MKSYPRSDDKVRREKEVGAMYTRLGDVHQSFIAKQIAELVPVAGDSEHAMRCVAQWQIMELLWRWTVDAVDAQGIVQIDAARGAGIWPNSVLAEQSAEKVVYEHVVPRSVITANLVEQDLRTTDAVLAALRRNCLTAVITRRETRIFSDIGLKSAMPSDWKWGDDPWARYKAARLYGDLRWPKDWPEQLPGC